MRDAGTAAKDAVKGLVGASPGGALQSRSRVFSQLTPARDRDANATTVDARLAAVQGKPPPAMAYPTELSPRANCFMWALAIDPAEWDDMRKDGVDPFLQVPTFAPLVSAVKGRLVGKQINNSTNIFPITQGTLYEVLRLGQLRHKGRSYPLIMHPLRVSEGGTPRVRGAPPMRYYRMAVYVSQRDFHFARQHTDAKGRIGWSHKPGGTGLPRSIGGDRSRTLSCGRRRGRGRPRSIGAPSRERGRIDCARVRTA